METYIETVNRYVVEYLEDLPESHKAELRIRGIDSDNSWKLKWSFEEESDAIKQLNIEVEGHKEFCDRHGFTTDTKFRVRDLGSTQYIERSLFF